jgi:hypothetical protein
MRKLFRIRNSAINNYAEPVYADADGNFKYLIRWSDGPQNFGVSYEQNEWYNVKLKIDIPDKSVTVTISQDDAVLVDQKIKPVNLNNMTEFEFVHTTMAGAADVEAATYVDDLKIYTLVEKTAITDAFIQDENDNPITDFENTLVPVNSKSFALKFNKEMNADTLNENNITLKKCGGKYPVSYVPYFDAANKAFYITFNDELDFQTDYEVEVSTNVSAADGVPLFSEETYNFVTDGGDIYISNAQFTDLDDNVIENVGTNKKVKFSADIVNRLDNAQSAVLIIALYDSEGAMVTFNKKTVELEHGVNPANIELDTEKFSTGSKICVWLWDNQINMKAYSYGNEIN